jgi:hypothetical protein
MVPAGVALVNAVTSLKSGQTTGVALANGLTSCASGTASANEGADAYQKKVVGPISCAHLKSDRSGGRYQIAGPNQPLMPSECITSATFRNRFMCLQSLKFGESSAPQTLESTVAWHTRQARTGTGGTGEFGQTLDS